jgi:hypothetical protein
MIFIPVTPRDIRHNMMPLQVHLHQRLLHVLDMRSGRVQLPLPLAQIGTKRGGLAFWMEAGAQESIFGQAAQSAAPPPR